MERTDFYTDRKFCDSCERYVHYLMSVETSFCVECGAKVHLFSKRDWDTFQENLSERTKGGRPRQRPRRDQGKESA